VFGIVTTLRAARSGDLVRVWARVSSLLQIHERLRGPKQPILQGVKESLREARWPGLEFNVSFPSCCDINNE
jgi:hypothetical protein